MHTYSRLMLALACAAIAAAPAVAQPTPASPTVATVNGAAIPKALFDTMLKERLQQGAPDSDQLRKAVVNELVSRELVVQEAARKGLSESMDLKAQIELSRQTVIVRAYVVDLLKTHPVTDEELRAEYEKVKGQLADKEYKARHILLEKEADAKDIIAKLDKGEKFADLARFSKDPGSRDSGGDLHWNAPAAYVKPFSDAMVRLEKGRYTETPVQTQFGWHVIQLDDSRPTKTPTFDEVKPRLLQRMQQLEIEKALAGLRAKAKIE